MNMKERRSLPRDVIVTSQNTSDKERKTTGHLKRHMNQDGVGLLTETINARGKWSSIFKILRENDFQ